MAGQLQQRPAQCTSLWHALAWLPAGRGHTCILIQQRGEAQVPRYPGYWSICWPASPWVLSVPAERVRPAAEFSVRESGERGGFPSVLEGPAQQTTLTDLSPFHSVRGSESYASHPTGAQWGPEPSRTTTARANCLVKTSVSANRLCPCHSQAQPAVLCQEPQSHPVTNSS